MVVIAGANDIADAASRIADRLAASRPVALAFRLPPLTTDAAEALIRAGIRRVVDRSGRPDLVVVSGGDTLKRLADAVGATRLVAAGEWRPGIAVSSFPDGLWDGTKILSKSGAFGDDAFLIDSFGFDKGRSA